MKNVLVTGSTGTLGEELIKTLSKNNYNVIAHYHTNEIKVQKLKEQLPNIEFIKSDLTSEEEINKMIGKINEKYKHIDILINNAAFYQDEALEEKTKETFMKVLDVNLIAPFLLSKKIGKYMLEEKKGKIINIASTNGIDTFYPESVDYDASKAALINLTKNMAKYYAPYITVNAIAPGWIETKETLNMEEKFKKEETNKILLKRFAKPNEIVECIMFVCANDYINSSVIRIDGGKE